MKLSPGAGIALGIGALVVLYFVMKSKAAPAAAPAAAQPAALPINIAPFPIISNAGVSVDVQPALQPLQLTFN